MIFGILRKTSCSPVIAKSFLKKSQSPHFSRSFRISSIMSIADKGDTSALSELDDKGAFKRSESEFRHWVKADGSTDFPAEKDRYVLYVAHACPWANRTLIARKLKKLDDVIDVIFVSPVWDYDLSKYAKHMPEGSRSWSFDPSQATGHNEYENMFVDTLYPQHKVLAQLYWKEDPEKSKKFTVPVLYDKIQQRIVNNESSEILRMLNSEFEAFSSSDIDLYPKDLQSAIDKANEWIYPMINDGVYKCGFARSQNAYDEAAKELEKGLFKVEQILSEQRFIADNKRLTEADIRLFVTLIRFDQVYAVHFKTNMARIEMMENTFNWMVDVYQTSGVGDTINMEYIKRHYYGTHKAINPFLIIPKGRDIDYSSLKHNRDRF